jgi:hypothetical protein
VQPENAARARPGLIVARLAIELRQAAVVFQPDQHELHPVFVGFIQVVHRLQDPRAIDIVHGVRQEQHRLLEGVQADMIRRIGRLRRQRRKRDGLERRLVLLRRHRARGVGDEAVQEHQDGFGFVGQQRVVEVAVRVFRTLQDAFQGQQPQVRHGRSAIRREGEVKLHVGPPLIRTVRGDTVTPAVEAIRYASRRTSYTRHEYAPTT